jgi:hypothetical protein
MTLASGVPPGITIVLKTMKSNYLLEPL